MKKHNILAIILTVIALVIGITSCSFPTESSTTTQEGPPDNPATIVDVTITEAKTDFAFAEDFSYSEMVVTATMSDGSQKELSSDEYTVVCEDFNCMKTGTYQAELNVIGTDISKSYDVTVSPANQLKVLMIGNSFADDTINYAYEIAKNAGIPVQNILIADIYIGGCSIDTHWSNAQSNAPAYRFGLEREGYFDGSSYQNWTMEQAIKFAKWDFITFQQNSGNSGIPSTYSNLQNLMNYVYDIATDEEINPNANPNVKFAWHQTWAYAQSTTNSAFSAYNKNQMTMYDAIQSALQSQILNKDFVAIIPNGTAIQNARTSFLGDSLTRDQYDHLSHEAGRYIAAMGLVSTLTGRDLTDLTWKPQNSGFDFNISNEVLAVCKESVSNALASPYQVTPSKYPPDSISSILEGEGTKENPYLIQSAEDMWALSEFTKGKSFGDRNMYFKLTADIDLGTESWQPICSSSSSGWVETANSFNANFDGNGKTITFVGNYTGDTWAKGLFSAVGGHVHDLTLRGTITMEKGRAGSLASMASAGAVIENVISYVNISGSNNQIGGIIGYIAAADVTIKNCKNYGTVQARELVGGIVGGSWQNVTYINCENHGTVIASSARVGGIAGEKFAVATLTNCSNTGSISAAGTAASSDSGTANLYVGYLIGQEK